MFRLISVSILTTAYLILITIPVAARIITVEYKGMIRGIDDTISSNFSLNDPISGYFSYETISTATPYTYSDALFFYNEAPIEITLKIGDYTVHNGYSDRVEVTNDRPWSNRTGVFDRFIIQDHRPIADNVNGYEISNFSLNFYHERGGVFQDRSLPDPFPDFSAFTRAHWMVDYVTGIDPEHRIHGYITSARAVTVSEPQILLILLFGIAFIRLRLSI